jgi:hypothetical protein
LGNDLGAQLTRFCLALEEYRRTPEGRVRTSEEFLAHFFPHDQDIAADLILRLVPREIRGPILTGWGIRGAKAALTDSDEKVEEIVHDALRAGDLDHVAFETALTPEITISALPLSEWWMFWRTGKLSAPVLSRAVITAHDIGLFDAKWFLDALVGPDGHTRGIDVFAAKLPKPELAAWVFRIAESGDATPEGIVKALGWEKMLENTSTSAMLGVLDALVKKVGLLFELPDALAAVDDLESTFVSSWEDRKADRKEAALREKREEANKKRVR